MKFKEQNDFLTLNDVKKRLNLTPQQKKEIQIEMDLIEASIKARKDANLTQKQLSEKSGLAQPVIARIESRKRSPQLTTLLKMLEPTGHTLKVVPLKESKNKNKNLKIKDI